MADVAVLGTPEVSSDTGVDTATITYEPEDGTGRVLLFEVMWSTTDATELSNIGYGGEDGAESLNFRSLAITWTPAVGYAVGVLAIPDDYDGGTELEIVFLGALGCAATVRAWTIGNVVSIGEFGSGGAQDTDQELHFELDETYQLAGNALMFSGGCAFLPDSLATTVETIQLADAPADTVYTDMLEHHHTDVTLDAVGATWPASTSDFQTEWISTLAISGEADSYARVITIALIGEEDAAAQFNCDCQEVSPYRTLLQLRQEFLRGTGFASQAANPPPGMTELATFYLQMAQDFLIDSYKQVTLERFFRWTMEPGQRYYSIAEGNDACADVLDPLKVTWVGFEDLNRTWVQLIEGIPPEFYTRVQTAPGWPSHYEIRQCIEVFPAPQAAYTLWVKANSSKAPFAANDSHPTMDDAAVVFMAIGMYREDYNKPGAARWKGMAKERIMQIVAGQHNTARYVPKPRGLLPPETPPIFLPLNGAPS